MIALRDVRKVFNGGKANEYEALRGVTLEVRQERMTVFTGPSGSGKTTLLSVIAGMARPTSGRVFLSGREITSLPERYLADIRRKTFGFIFQQFHLIKGISALENVMAPAYPTGAAHRALRDRAMGLLASQGIASKAEARVEWLSGGEAQRVAIARALMNDPPVVIADEPTAHLDTQLSREFLEIVGRLKREGKAAIVASHDPLVYESAIVDRVISMRDGTIVREER